MAMNIRASALVKRCLNAAQQRQLLNIRSRLGTTISRSLSTLISSTTSPPFGTSAVRNSPDDSRTCRKFSTYPNGVTAYPQYTVYGETCLFAMKPMMPVYRVSNYQGRYPHLAFESQSKRGRIIFEWVPRDPDGSTARDRSIRFALSPEEIGFVLDQLPKQNQVVLMRRPRPTEEPGAKEAPHKVLHVTPGQGGMVSFKVDFEIDGVGGQETSSPEISGPLEVVVQAGEFQVIMSLMQHSLPLLTGWSTMMEVALQNSLARTFQEAGRGGGPGAGGHFSSSDQGGNMPY